MTILIMVLWLGSNPTMFTAEFETREACTTAMSQMEWIRKGAQKSVLVCAGKGERRI